MLTPTLPRLSTTLRAAGLAALAGAPLLALAHGGSDGGAHHGLAAGLAHPFSGLDHLAAMLAVGWWSASTARTGRAQWVAPLSFVLLLALGALLTAAGVLALPAIEPMIALSLLALGLLLASQRHLPAPAAGLLVGGFALFHGAAHGQELAGTDALAGMLLATLALHLSGMALGRTLTPRLPWLARLAGLGLGALGAGLLWA